MRVLWGDRIRRKNVCVPVLILLLCVLFSACDSKEKTEQGSALRKPQESWESQEKSEKPGGYETQDSEKPPETEEAPRTQETPVTEETQENQKPEEDNSQKKYRDNTSVVKVPSADGVQLYEEGVVSVDASNISDGYVMVNYKGSNPKVRMLLTGPNGIEYKYFLEGYGEYEAFPLSEGSGKYHLEVFENIEGNRYALVYSVNLDAQISDETKMFLYANQYVDFTEKSQAVSYAKELAKEAGTDLEVVEAVYHYVTDHITYDYDKAKSVTSRYLPNIDDTLTSKKGICFDYAALMTAMLRSQRIPTRLEIGYREEVYHAWIGVYIQELGWIDDVIVFDGEEWVLMDPTLAADAKKSTVEKYMKEKETYYQLRFKY